MCQNCQPAGLHLAQNAMRNFDGSDLLTLQDQTVGNSREDIVKALSQDSTIYHGKIITMKDGKFSPVEALGIQNDRILATGSLEDVKSAFPPDVSPEIIELGDRAILPGFIEPHVHVLFSALTSYFLLQFSPQYISTREAALELVKKTAQDKAHKSNPKLWISGFGYDPSRIVDYKDLDRNLLDKVSPNSPVYIMNQSGHLAYVNTIALKLAGKSDENTKVSDGYEKDAGGHLTGVLKELAVAEIGAVIDQPDPQKIPTWWNGVLNTWTSKGVTTICDMGIGSVNPVTDTTTYSQLTNAFPPPVRFHGAVAIQASKNYEPFTPPVSVGKVNVNTIKYWSDGSTQGFTAAVKEPYLASEGEELLNWGHLNYSDEGELYATVLPFFKKGWQIAIHANGDRAAEQVLRVYEELYRRYPDIWKKNVHRIEHFTVTGPEQVQKVKELGLGVSHLMGHVHFWGDTFRKHVLGSPRAERIDPVKDDDDNGVTFSFHSDSPVSDVDPLLYVRTAVTRLIKVRDGEEVLGEEQRVDLETALRGITINPAIQIGVEKDVGTLEEGKKADFVILEKDPREVAVEYLHKIAVLETFMGGTRTWQKT